MSLSLNKFKKYLELSEPLLYNGIKRYLVIDNKACLKLINKLISKPYKFKELNIKGYYFVRQQRIPTFLFSGLSIGVDTVSGVPCLDLSEGGQNPKLVTESFVNKNKEKIISMNYSMKTQRFLKLENQIFFRKLWFLNTLS